MSMVLGVRQLKQIPWLIVLGKRIILFGKLCMSQLIMLMWESLDAILIMIFGSYFNKGNTDTVLISCSGMKHENL